VFKAAGTWVETLDCLLDTYAEIGEILPGLSQYGDLLKRHPYIGVHLHSYYCDVLEFHRKALSVFSRPSAL
jgi:lipopolysaccharide biosynthesis protein